MGDRSHDEWGQETRDIDICPKDTRGQRACMSCSLVKTFDQFLDHGCENCPFLHMKESQEQVEDCTSGNFFGMIALMDTEKSWVGNWQHIEKLLPGCYALQVNGRLPPDILELLPPKMKNRYLRSQAAAEGK